MIELARGHSSDDGRLFDHQCCNADFPYAFAARGYRDCMTRYCAPRADHPRANVMSVGTQATVVNKPDEFRVVEECLLVPDL